MGGGWEEGRVQHFDFLFASLGDVVLPQRIKAKTLPSKFDPTKMEIAVTSLESVSNRLKLLVPFEFFLAFHH